MIIPKLNHFKVVDEETNESRFIEKSKKKYKPCLNPECGNLVEDRAHIEFCTDQECFKNRPKKEYVQHSVYPETVNLILPKNEKLRGASVKIRCCSNGVNGRCTNTFTINYKLNRKTYPKYCVDHRNEWKRKLWEEKKLEPVLNGGNRYSEDDTSRDNSPC